MNSQLIRIMLMTLNSINLRSKETSRQMAEFPRYLSFCLQSVTAIQSNGRDLCDAMLPLLMFFFCWI
jgi:hypothetical protein